MQITYRPRGVCASAMVLDIEDDVVKDVKIVGGCRGNTLGLSRLCVGRNVHDLIPLLEGIPCRGATSCPDQLSRAMKEYLANENKL